MARFDSSTGRYVYLTIDGVEYRVYFEESGAGLPLLLQHTAGADGRRRAVLPLVARRWTIRREASCHHVGRVSARQEQQAHLHDTQEQVYVIIRGRGIMRVGDEQHDVRAGTLVFVPPGSDHSVRNDSAEPMAYVSATSPPFDSAMLGALYRDG